MKLDKSDTTVELSILRLRRAIRNTSENNTIEAWSKCNGNR